MMDERSRMNGNRRRRILIALVAAVVGVAITVPLAGALLQQMFGSDPAATSEAAQTSAAPPVYTIKPLVVRPVITVEGVAPDGCPPPAPVPASETLRTCDFANSALYTLGPEAVQLQLIRVDSLLSPITNGFIVQVAMTAESATAFADFTQTQIGKQVAFVRAAEVVSAPQISEAIAGDTLQLSGELTEQQSQEMARLLRDEA